MHLIVSILKNDMIAIWRSFFENFQIIIKMAIENKISNYIFRFDDKIGQGNFSKVYKGFHQLTSNSPIIQL